MIKIETRCFVWRLFPGVYDLSEASGTITNELLSRLGSRLNRMILYLLGATLFGWNLAFLAC